MRCTPLTVTVFATAALCVLSATRTYGEETSPSLPCWPTTLHLLTLTLARLLHTALHCGVKTYDGTYAICP